MKPHRLSLRFRPDRPEDCKAWEALRSVDGSRNALIIRAINAYFRTSEDIAEVVRSTIRECLNGQLLVNTVEPEAEVPLSEEDEALLDAMDSFLGM